MQLVPDSVRLIDKVGGEKGDQSLVQPPNRSIRGEREEGKSLGEYFAQNASLPWSRKGEEEGGLVLTIV